MKPTATVAISSLLLLGTSLVSASECTLPPCGRVENNTPYAMKWADLGKNNGNCRLWNANGGGSMSERTVHCEQNNVGANTGKGGWNYSPRVDVDAFCYPSSGYWVRFGNEAGEHYVGAGEWVKISSLQTATCDDQGRVIHCRVRG